MKHDSACSSNDSQSSNVEECEEWVNRWITEVVIPKKYKSDVPPCYFKTTGKNPLHYAARYGRFEMCEYLKSEFEDKKSGDGTSCLMMAVYGGSIDCINLLGGEELYEDKNDWGCMCTHFAGLSKKIEVVEYFNKIGVDWMKKQKNGHTAIDKAAIVGWREGIERMWKGQDIDLTGKWKGGSKEDRRWLIEKGLLRDDNDDKS
ncbi:hypothetical protein TL16_g07269 [Triparma laevis f. inornata]|uniref:Ankyrin repeat protein n=1 Tax=Triparma laevis f. inornata TaxID=1714386 RepID=A0A9W7AX05_9STRA|nr:hypothetical protein TL16_g07269 [Triparma laevis f. inornata]